MTMSSAPHEQDHERHQHLGMIAQKLEGASPQEILRWAVPEYQPKISLACSFGMQSVVIIDMLHKLDLLKQVEVFYIDTGVLFDETHQLRLKITEKYGITPLAVNPKLTMAQQAEKYGDRLWESNPNLCCQMRKVEPLKNYLTNRDAWITGMRRSHSQTRAQIPVVMWDQANQLAKINPVAPWDDKILWDYILTHHVPYNKLYDEGYASIGCTHCTQKAETRDGRWQNSKKTECGIHVDGHVISSLDSSQL